MTTEYDRRLRSLGIRAPRLRGESAHDLYDHQIERFAAHLPVISDNDIRNPGALRGFSHQMRHVCIEVVHTIMEQVQEDNELEEYWERQLLDMLLKIVESDRHGNRRVSPSIIKAIQDVTQICDEDCPVPIHVDINRMTMLWKFVFTNVQSAVDENVMSFLGLTFSQFLLEFKRERERFALPSILKRVTAGVDINEDCAICTEEVKPGEDLIALAPFCTHRFHSNCIEAWFKSKNQGSGTCPMCRTKIDFD